MADVTLGGILLASTGAAQPKVDSFGSLAACAAGIIDANQPAILSTARAGILRGIDDINMRHLFRFGRKAASDATIVASQNNYSVAADFFAIDTIQLIDSNSRVYRQLDYVPWQQFNSMYTKQADDSTPRIWTSRNTFDDEEILVYPRPTSSDASSYTLRIVYYERIERVDQDSDIIVAPRELGHVLCLYGEYHVLERHDRSDEGRIQRKLAEYRNALEAFTNQDKREPAERLQFQLAMDQNDSLNTDLYIKVK